MTHGGPLALGLLTICPVYGQKVTVTQKAQERRLADRTITRTTTIVVVEPTWERPGDPLGSPANEARERVLAETEVA